MARLTPDPTFYPSAKMATEAPPESLAYITMMNPTREGLPDAIGVVDVDPNSDSYAQLVGKVEMPEAGDELHHFGCSSSGISRPASVDFALRRRPLSDDRRHGRCRSRWKRC